MQILYSYSLCIPIYFNIKESFPSSPQGILIFLRNVSCRFLDNQKKKCAWTLLSYIPIEMPSWWFNVIFYSLIEMWLRKIHVKKVPLSFIKVYSQILAKIVLNILYTRNHTIHFNEVFPLSLVAHKCPLSPLAQDARPWSSSSQGVVLGPASASLRILLRIHIFSDVLPDLLNQKPWSWNTAICFLTGPPGDSHGC